MKIFFIRHQKTNGNLKRQYIGKTDENILPFENKITYPQGEILFTSSLKRTIQTANTIYKNQPYISIQELNECDFGLFEGKSFEELKDNEDYRAYISSNGKMTPPEGENINDFKNRCCDGFLKAIEIAKEKGATSAVFVLHGGSIMAIMERFSDVKDFYFWQIKNLSYISFDLEETEAKTLKIKNWKKEE